MDVVTAPQGLLQKQADNSIYCALLLNDERIIYLNRQARDLFGLSIKLPTLHPSDLSPEYQPSGQPSRLLAQNFIKTAIDDGSASFHWVHHTVDGRLFQCKVRLDYLGNAWLLGELSEVRFLDEVRHSDSQTQSDKLFNYTLLYQHKRAIDQSAIVSKTDTSGIITYVNDRFCEVSGYSRHELIGKKHSIISHPETPRKLFDQLWGNISSGKVWRGVIRNRAKNGSSYYVSTTICPILGVGNQITEYISIRFDLTQLYDLKRLALIQSTDQETQLANSTRLHHDISSFKPGHMLILDFQALADIAQVYPRETYQQLLHEIAQLITGYWHIDLSRLYRVTDTQFAFSVSDAELNDDVSRLARHFSDNIGVHEFVIDNNTLFIGVKIGIAQTDGSYEAVKKAQLCSKSIPDYGLPVARYEEQDNARNSLIETLEWAGKLNQALQEGKITFVCQGIHSNDGQRVSEEILMRLQDPVSGELVSPELFICHAKRAKIYGKLTRRLIETVFSHLSHSRHAFSINLDVDDIYSPLTSAFLFKMIAKYDLASRLTIELIESAELDFNDKRVGDFIHRLKQLGCSIAIDDFGSGYSNFTYLATLPVDVVKIDGSLIRDITGNRRKLEIVHSIVALCKRLEIVTVAEYVASNETFELLDSLGVDRFQGYWFSAPEPCSH